MHIYQLEHSHLAGGGLLLNAGKTFRNETFPFPAARRQKMQRGENKLKTSACTSPRGGFPPHSLQPRDTGSGLELRCTLALFPLCLRCWRQGLTFALHSPSPGHTGCNTVGMEIRCQSVLADRFVCVCVCHAPTTPFYKQRANWFPLQSYFKVFFDYDNTQVVIAVANINFPELFVC